MSSRLTRFAPVLIATVFVISRLLFQPVSLGVSSVSFRGNLRDRAAAAISGRNFDLETLGNGMPIIDRALLLNDLGRSLWYLHSQPPLFNLLVAGMLRLPGDFARNYQWLNWAFGLALYLLTYRLMIICGALPSAASAAVIVFMLNPNALWMESAVYYGLPLALLLVLGSLAYWRALRTDSIAWLFGASIVIVILPLIRAFFTAIWCGVVLAFFAVTFIHLNGKRRWRAAAAASLPFLLILGFQVKQFVVFGQTLGSSWFGCNLAAMTAGMKQDKIDDLAAGRVSALVNVYRNGPPELYQPYFALPNTGISILDQTRKSTGQPNFHNGIYRAVGQQYLRDTLYLISHHPHKYLINVANSLYLFCGYQIGIYFDRPSRVLSRFTLTEIGAPFIGLPIFILTIITALQRIRRPEGAAAERLLMVYLFGNIGYVAAVSWFLEKSESAVYRFQIDAFLWTFLALWVSSRLRALAASTGWQRAEPGSGVREPV